MRAMRWGIAPDDSHYLPVFPFPYYNRLTDRDLADIKAFLDTLPPVSRPELPRSSMALWERARAAVAVAATPMPGPWRDDPTRDAGMESRCLPRRHDRPLRRVPYAAHLARHPRSGSLSRGWPRPERAAAAPNITSDPKAGIGNWSTDDIVTMLTDGTTPNFDEVGHSMAEIVKNTAKLNEEDRRAIAVYLQSVPPISGPERK